VLQNDWFGHYLKSFDTVEINASFYSWPTVAGVQAWRRQSGRKKFVYTVKVCELITHIKKFKGTKTLVKGFWHDRRHSRRQHGMFSVSAPAELSLHQDPA
jgi:uncharacterized protein YecE (DUF72 family)